MVNMLLVANQWSGQALDCAAKLSESKLESSQEEGSSLDPEDDSKSEEGFFLRL
jgi:hypothetical protein